MTHVRPDFLRGAAEMPVLGSDDCLAEPASGSGRRARSLHHGHRHQALGDRGPRLHVREPRQRRRPPARDRSELAGGARPRSSTPTSRSAASSRTSRRAASGGTACSIVTADHSFSWNGPLPTQRIDLESLFAADADDRSAPARRSWSCRAAARRRSTLPSIAVGATSLTASQQTALKRMREIALAQTGVSEAFYRIENALDPGATLAANRPAWGIADQRAGDLVVTALASGPTTGSARIRSARAATRSRSRVGRGLHARVAARAPRACCKAQHGHPGTRHIPFYVIGGGDHVVDQTIAASGPINEGDDTARESRPGRERRHRADGGMDLRPRPRDGAARRRPAACSARRSAACRRR